MYIETHFSVSSPPQSRSQAVVCVSTTRMYLRSGHFQLCTYFNKCFFVNKVKVIGANEKWYSYLIWQELFKRTLFFRASRKLKLKTSWRQGPFCIKIVTKLVVFLPASWGSTCILSYSRLWSFQLCKKCMIMDQTF